MNARRMTVLCFGLSLLLCGFMQAKVTKAEEDPFTAGTDIHTETNTKEEIDPNIGTLESPPSSGHIGDNEISAYLEKVYADAAANTRSYSYFLSSESFETTGQIPETLNPVPKFEHNIPVRIIDQNGEPVYNAGIVSTYDQLTELSQYSKNVVFRVRPRLDSTCNMEITNEQGQAIIPYHGRFTEVTLFVFTSDVLKEYWGKCVNPQEYPACTRFDVTISPENVSKEIVLQIETPEKAKVSESPSLKLRLWHNGHSAVDYLCFLIPLETPQKLAEYENGASYDPQVGHIPALPASVRTDKNGLAVFEFLEPGTYTLYIQKHNERTSLKHTTVTIKENKTAVQIILLSDEPENK